MEVFPGDDFPEGLATIRRMIDELLSNDLLIEYEVDGASYWQVTGWKHQKIDKPSPKYPLPQVQTKKNSTTIRRTVPERSDTVPGLVVLGMEGNGMEGSIRAKKKFVKPTQEEVEAYMDERNKIPQSERRKLSERFINHYEMKGWVVGKSPMKSWQAAVRTWEANQDNYRTPNATTEGEGWQPYVKPEYK
jgi:hypothetical protein